MRSLSSFGLFTVGILTIATYVACSSDKSNDSGTSPDKTEDGGTKGGTKTVKAIFYPDGGLYCPPDIPIADNDTCIAMDDAVAKCKTVSQMQVPGTSVDDTSCGAGCTCTKCTQLMLDCGNDPDGYCSTVIKCANDKNCTGVACYAAATCQDVIDAAPNGGLSSNSVGLATAVSNCIAPMGGAMVCSPSCNK
jgi:hypothetical protein